MNKKIYYSITQICSLASLLAIRIDELLLQKTGIGLAQYKLMAILDEYPACTQQWLAQKLYQSEPSISRQVAILKKRQHLVVDRLPSDKRNRQIRLTPLGTSVLRSAQDALLGIDYDISRNLSTSQKTALQQVSPILVDLLESSKAMKQ
jgi:DNA-binding MarR family transcriptional regulator